MKNTDKKDIDKKESYVKALAVKRFVEHLCLLSECNIISKKTLTYSDLHDAMFVYVNKSYGVNFFEEK